MDGAPDPCSAEMPANREGAPSGGRALETARWAFRSRLHACLTAPGACATTESGPTPLCATGPPRRALWVELRARRARARRPAHIQTQGLCKS